MLTVVCSNANITTTQFCGHDKLVRLHSKAYYTALLALGTLLLLGRCQERHTASKNQTINAAKKNVPRQKFDFLPNG